MTQSFVLEGSEALFEALREIPEKLPVSSATEQTAAILADRVKENTPPGYNKKLDKSVLYVSESPDEYLIGYERGVETAGGPELDSVTRPRTRGRSVLSRPRREWVDADRLASVLEQTFEDYATETVRSLADGVARGLA